MSETAAYVVLNSPEAVAKTGYTVKAMKRKIERGQWVNGREYVIAPDGRRMLSVRGFEKWVERGRA